MTTRSNPRIFLAPLVLILAIFWSVPPALGAESPAPYWGLESRVAPTHLPLEGEEFHGVGAAGIKGEGAIVVTATNLGDATVNGNELGGKMGSPVVLTDTLPEGVEPLPEKATGFTGEGVPGLGGNRLEEKCPVTGRVVTCTFEDDIVPYEHVEIRIPVKSRFKAPPTAAVENEVSVSGGEAPEAKLRRAVQVGGGETTFGLENLELKPENEDGTPNTQAGSHPYQLTTTFDLNQTLGVDDQLTFPNNKVPLPTAPALQREIITKIPPGLLGDPLAAPRCTGTEFGALDEKTINSCPDSSAIGVAVVTFNDPETFGYEQWSVPIFNLEPEPGAPARFGFEIVHVPVVLDAHVRTGEDYGVTVTVHNTSEAVQVLGAKVILWGQPGSPVHDESRGWDCIGNGHYASGFTPPHSCPHGGLSQTPYLFMPTSCPTASQAVTVGGRSWNNEPLSGSAEFPAMKGCEKLPFNPSISVKPDESSASTPTGLNVDVNMPQKTTTLDPSSLAESDLEATTLALPLGLQASAGAANGLETCSTGQVGFNEGPSLGTSLEAQQFTAAEPGCPNAAKIGTVSVETPVLEHELLGSVYLGTQDTNPFASPLVLYLVAEEKASKVLIKLAGEVAINPVTGQLTSSFRNTPQAPFERLHLHLFSGPRASQATPGHCGTYNAAGVFTPWSGSAPANAGQEPGEGFEITSGPGGGACPGATLPTQPGLSAGSVNPQAGVFSPFSLTLSRPDGQQGINSLSVHLPEGVAAMLKNVTPCPEPPVGQPWSCGPASLIGHSTASSGLGVSPVTLGGTAYLTTGYDGAPFGLLDETLAKAGPFNLGIVDVRSRINVDQTTAAVTVTTDPGPHGDALPTILKGVPVQLKQINVTTDRPEFQFNPTNCTPQSVSATVGGDEGGSGTASTNYNVTGCAALPFHPKLSVELETNVSRVDGTGMKIVVESGPGQSNIGKTKLEFPRTVPSRLETLHKACLAAVFEANPANCAEGAVIGIATAYTPVLKSPLTGPVYLVSHGNAAFPDAEIVLQGEGIKLLLDGKTYIAPSGPSKGVTSSTFEVLPDAPVTKFEVSLPRGPHSAFSGYGELCEEKPQMPTYFHGQNGAELDSITPIKLTSPGCVEVHKFHVESELAKLLKQCRKVKNKKVRARCEATARKRVAAVTACKHKNKSNKKKRAACEAKARRKYVLRFK